MKIQGAGATKASATGGGHEARFTSAVNGAAHNRSQAQQGRGAQQPRGDQRADGRGHGQDGGRADRKDAGRGDSPHRGDHDGRTKGNQRFDTNPHGNGIDFGRWPGRGGGGGRGPDLLGGHGRGIGNDFGFGRGDGRSQHPGFDFRGDLARSATVFTAGPHFSDTIHGRYGEPNGAPASHHLLGLTQAAFRDAAAAVRMAAHTSPQMRDSWRPHMDGYRGHGDLTSLRQISEDYRFLHSLRSDHRGPAELLDAIFEYRVQRQLAAECMPGTACAPHSQPVVTGSWLREAAFGVAPVPGQVAAKLSGQEFSDFAAFTRAFWQAVARTPDLAMTFSEANLARMRQGLAPLAPEAQNVAELRAYMLEHKLSVAQGGEVYDLNNLVILTPAMSQLVADLRYNYAIMNIMYNQFLRDPSDRRRRKHARRRYAGKDEFAFGRWLRKKWQHLRRRRRWRRMQLPTEARWPGRLAKRLLGAAPA
jgi:hypothetical protein